MKNKISIATHLLSDSAGSKFSAALRGQYSIGVDLAAGGDYSCTTVMRRPSGIERLLRRLKLSRATWEFKIVDQYYEGRHT